MDDEYYDRINGVFDLFNEADRAFAKAGAVAGAEGFIDTLIDAGFSKLQIEPIGLAITYISKALEWTSNYDEILASDLELMTLATMSAKTDISRTSMEENYTYRLWANLQVRGCEKAEEYLDLYTENGFTY